MIPEGSAGSADPGIEQPGAAGEAGEVQSALRDSEHRYRSLFQDSPISLWEEDFSEVKGYIDALREAGVSDLWAYFEEHPEAVTRCANLVKIERVNRATIRLLGVESEEALLAGLSRVFTRQSLAAFREELLALAEGNTTWEGEVPHRTLMGEEIYVTLHLAVAQGYEDTWGRVFVSLVDTTERRRAEEALRESEERFRRIADNAPDIVFRWSVKNGLEYVSPIVAEITGYEPEELTKDPMLGFEIATGKNPQIVADYQYAIAVGAAIPAREFSYVRKDGSTAYFDARSAAVKDKEGCVVAFEGILRDVTDRKDADRVLRESEERFRSIFENAVMGLYRSTPEGQILMANPALVRMLGFSSFEELAGRNLGEEGYATGYPRSSFQEIVEQEGQVVGFETAWLKPDGGIVYLRESAWAIRAEDGSTRYYEGTIEDVTEQRLAEKRLQENEERYRALFERTNDAVFILDLDGVHLMVNRQAAHLLGYAEEEMVGMSVRQVVAPSEYGSSQNKLTALQAGESLPVYERTFLRKDGSQVPVEINAALVYDAAGQPLHIQSVVRDITARKRAEAERERLLLDLMHRSTQLLTAAEVSKSASTILEPEELMA